jgi:hypothetical protein
MQVERLDEHIDQSSVKNSQAVDWESGNGIAA